MTLLLGIVILVPLLGWPVYIIGERLDVPNARLAFIPLLGPYIVLWQSIRSSGWNVLLLCIPVVNLGALIYLAYTLPTRHGRSQAWTLWFVVPLINIAGFWVYAYTLPPRPPDSVYGVGSVAPPTTEPASPRYASIFKD